MVTSSKKHICIDFEGEGKKGDGSVPHPSILGALVPNIDGQGSQYFLWVFEKELTPLTRSPKITGRSENRKVCSLEEAILDLIKLADERECRLIAYSDHELNMVNMHLGQKSDARKRFEARFYNILPKSRALANRRRLNRKDNKLKTLLTALSPSHKWPPPPKIGVAEACRQLRTAGTKSKRWRKWSPKHQQMAEDLIAYNRGDCKAVWRLTNRVSSNYKIAELFVNNDDAVRLLGQKVKS